MRDLVGYTQPPAAALSAPTQLRDVLSTLREIMSVYATSLLENEVTTATTAAKREEDFRDVLDAALDPAIEMCGKMAEMRQAEWDRAVLWINCDESVLGTLEGYDFVDARRRAVEEDEAKHVESLTAELVSPPLPVRASFFTEDSQSALSLGEGKWARRDRHRASEQGCIGKLPFPRSPDFC